MGLQKNQDKSLDVKCVGPKIHCLNWDWLRSKPRQFSINGTFFLQIRINK